MAPFISESFNLDAEQEKWFAEYVLKKPITRPVSEQR